MTIQTTFNHGADVMPTSDAEPYPTSTEMTTLIKKALATDYVRSQQPLNYELNEALARLQRRTAVDQIAPHIARLILNYTVADLSMPDALLPLYQATYRTPSVKDQYNRAAGLSTLLSHIWFN